MSSFGGDNGFEDGVLESLSSNECVAKRVQFSRALSIRESKRERCTGLADVGHRFLLQRVPRGLCSSERG